MSEHNLDALARVRPEPGWLGVFTREEAPGALGNGTPVAKVRSEPGDTFPDGTRGTVLGSIGPGPDEPTPTPHGATIPPGAYLYFVEWEPRPRYAIAIASNRLAAVVAEHRRRLEQIRGVLMREPELREPAEALVQELLVELDGLDDDAPVAELGGVRIYGEDDGFPTLTAGEVRERLRWTLAELATRDQP